MGRLNDPRIGGVIGPAWAVRAASAMQSTPHAQHGVGFVVGLDSEVTVTSASGARVAGRVVAISPDVEHAASCAGPTVGLLFDPEANPRIRGWALAGVAPVGGALGARFLAAAHDRRADLAFVAALDDLARECATWFRAASAAPPPDRRVAQALESLRDPSAGELRAAGISAAHLMALFARDVGLPIRTYRLWRRLLVALLAFARSDATQAAHAAGFADLAHFSRTCRRMLGYSPTVLRDQMIGA